jgi:hypothetical protein
MKTTNPSPRPVSRGNLKAIPYEDTTAAKPPIPIALATPPPNTSQRDRILNKRPKTFDQQLSPYHARSRFNEDARRDSGLAPSSSTARDSRTTLGTDGGSSTSLKISPSLRKYPSQDDLPAKKTRRWGSPKVHVEPPPVPQLPFLGIMTQIPTSSLEDLTIPGQLEFSKRGSMLIGGRKVNNANGEPVKVSGVIGSRRKLSTSMLSPPMSLPTRVLSADDEMLSHKVRSMYEGGTDRDSDLIDGSSFHRGRSDRADDSIIPGNSSSSLINLNHILAANANGGPSARASSGATTTTSKRESMIIREETELAGGIEDWEDLRGGDVDRYGFIVPRRLDSESSSVNSPRIMTPEPPRIQRVSTLLQLASEAPRKGRGTMKRSPSAHSTVRSAATPPGSRPSSRFSRPASSQSSYRGSVNGNLRLRSATNRLPHNKGRRFVDEAGDMLTLPPGLADIAENGEDNKAAQELKKKEWEREEKWRKMAKVVKNRRDGGGMIFEFDTKSAKVIDRAWKGIPDRWRATAWHAFLTASAKKRKDSPKDDELIAVFKKLLDQGSPDDVQIDIDVPRTINSHIMFRRRYRGGQRLLFRVLHCLSIYFPDTGYVQGMAALTATLLCYFDEEMTFVMLVRMWQLRGLECLYKSGFEGLMKALEEFEKTWLAGGEVSVKLVGS